MVVIMKSCRDVIYHVRYRSVLFFGGKLRDGEEFVGLDGEAPVSAEHILAITVL